MNFSYLNDRDELFFFPTDDSAEQIFPVQAMNGARYIISDHNNADIISLVTADRHNNDLHLTLPSASPTTMVVKDFYLTNGKVFTLNPKGEYQQHIASQHDAAQGPVVVESQPAVMQETQPEVASLKVIQRAETVQSLEQLATSLNLSDAVTPQAPAIATPMAQPASLMALQEEPGVSVKPSITTMYDEVGARTGMLYSGSVTDDKLPLIQGVGQPGATLEFFQNGELIGYTTVNQAGEWSFTFDIPLEEGGQLFYVRDPATSQTSSYVVLIIDTVAPARAELSSITADNTGSIVALAKNGYTSDNTPTFSGKGEANSMIAIYNDKTLIGTTYADANGIWSFTPPYALPDGVYAGRAVAIDFSGNTGLSSAKFDFIIDTVPPAQPQIIEILDNEGTVTGPVANGAGTDDSTPTLNGHAEAGSRVTIFDNGVKVADVQSDAAGNWSYTPGAELNPGSHTFTVTATDMTGNVSTESLPWSIILVPGQPDVPVVDAVYDDRGETTLPVPSGDTTADATPLIRGSAEPDSVVIIYDNGKEIARVNTDSEGSWVFTPDAALDDGEHALTFVTQNPAGNQSEPSDPWVVIVDTTAPDAPVIGGVYDDVGNKTGNLANGDSTDDTRPTLNGTAEAGSVIAVYDNGEKLGETTADENGNWSFTPETDLSEGEHSLTVTATDTVGNTSVPSDAWELVIDTTAPVQPGIDGEGPGLSGVT
ncbi:MAG TPA: Ig-like domain-containing protein, partial [Scandinavium sp.]